MRWSRRSGPTTTAASPAWRPWTGRSWAGARAGARRRPSRKRHVRRVSASRPVGDDRERAMYLKTVRMRGFKSFAQNVDLRFDEGIAVVVGPNGSGKSNIADALQWAMAVQSPAQLRAPSGQDVLFSGSDSRPPSGVCEVELVLDNACGTLPLEFGEVSITRRLYRDSEGEYLINRARLRRLDVLELLAATALGREMHSVIGQGRVEEILLSKPYERRRFVEEAAGLGKYQRRRVRAEQKLVRVGAVLARARDLEREVLTRLRPLALQATAADRAARLGAEI